MYKRLEDRIREVIIAVQDVMNGHSDMAKKRIADVAVRRIIDIINENPEIIKRP